MTLECWFHVLLVRRAQREEFTCQFFVRRMVSIYIRVSTGEKVNVDVDLGSSVQELKSKIGELRSVDPELITFVFKGKILKDECLLEACGGFCLTRLTSRDYRGQYNSHGYHEEEDANRSERHTFYTCERRIGRCEERRVKGCCMEIIWWYNFEEYTHSLCSLSFQHQQRYEEYRLFFLQNPFKCF